MKFYLVEVVEPSRYTGYYHDEHKWGLPGVCCPTCGHVGGTAGLAYPCVDLSGLPEAPVLEEAWLEKNFERYVHLRELVRPFVPAGALLKPGATFGPLVGPASGTFSPITVCFDWMMLVWPEALAALQAEGVRGLKGCLTAMRFRQKSRPELLELQIESSGVLHEDCIPPGKAEPCPACYESSFRRPEHSFLKLDSLPSDRDIFRLANFSTMVVVTERFVTAVQRLGIEEVNFRELPVR